MTLPPIVSPLFRVEDDILQYKPYPSYPNWLDAWDVSGFTGDASLALEAAATAQTAADLALSNAATALAAANEADDTADAAQTTANTALANAAAALAAAVAAQATADSKLGTSVVSKLAEMYSDTAVVTGGTATIIESGSYRYNFTRFTTVLNAQMEWTFVGDLTAGASINVLYVQGSGAGTIDLSINGSNVGSKDMSAGGADNHKLWTVALSAGVHGIGRHTLRLKSGGAGSVGSAFAMTITKVWVVAT